MLYFASQLILVLIKHCFNREIAWLDNWIDCCLTASEQYFSYIHSPNTSHSLTSSVFESFRTDITCPCWSVVVYHIRDTKIVSSNPDHGEVYSIQHCDTVFQWLATGLSGFLWVLSFPPPIKLTVTIWLKYCWNWR